MSQQTIEALTAEVSRAVELQSIAVTVIVQLREGNVDLTALQQAADSLAASNTTLAAVLDGAGGPGGPPPAS